MDTTTSIEKAVNNFGYLEIKGFGINRSAYLFNELLLIEDSLEVLSFNDGFNWGYVGDAARQLAVAILYAYKKDKDFVRKHLETFTHAVIGQLSGGNFHVKFKIKEWLEQVDKVDGLPIHVYSFLQVKITENLFISKFLDFPNNGFRRGEFLAGTIEYQELEKCSELAILKAYYKKQTERKHPTNSEEKISLELGFVDGTWIYTGGMGSGLDKGTKSHKHGSIVW